MSRGHQPGVSIMWMGVGLGLIIGAFVTPVVGGVVGTGIIIAGAVIQFYLVAVRIPKGSSDTCKSP